MIERRKSLAGCCSHGPTGSSLNSLLAGLCLLGLLFGSSLLALFGHQSQTLVVQLGFDVGLKVAGAEAAVVCFADSSKELVEVLDGVTECV